MRTAVVLAAVLTLALPLCADAGGRSGRSHSSSSGKHHSHKHHHGGGAVFVGAGFYYAYPYYYGYPPYYYPYPDPNGVPLYPPAPVDPYWYYCRAANAYYPYVDNCPGGWERYLPGTPLG